MTNTRRDFIRNGLTFVSLGMTAPASLARAAAEAGSGAERAQSNGGNILVVLQMFGGNDGLNTVIPYTDPLYYSNRPTIGLHKADILPISDKIGLHPNMKPFQDLYKKGRLAIVQGVGYPNPNLSHFRSTEIWQTADPVSTVVQEGWLGRYFDDYGHIRTNPLDGINIGGELPKTLYSDYGSVVSMQNPAAFRLQPLYPYEQSAEVQAFLSLYSKGTAARNAKDLVKRIGMDAYTSSEKIQKALTTEQDNSPTPGTAYGQSLEVSYPAAANGRPSALADSLHTIVKLIAADMGTRIFYVSTGGYDTHANQRPTQDKLLADLAASIAAFFGELEQKGLADKVTLLTFSEFGRRVQENASAGTDHGTASSLFVVGGSVKGGLYGEYPALDDLNMGNFKFTTDFREVYATMLDKWLKVSSAKILEGSFNTLPLFG